MNRIAIVLIFFVSNLLANDVIPQRQESMQNFNKLMREATQLLKSGDVQSLNDIYGEIEIIMNEYPNLFPDESFKGKTKASSDIIDNRDAFNQIALETEQWASLAKIAAKNNDIEQVQQHHQNLYSSCKSCHSRFKN
jgi:cytochrome c556